jgi:putative ABC transport system permease protein
VGIDPGFISTQSANLTSLRQDAQASSHTETKGEANMRVDRLLFDLRLALKQIIRNPRFSLTIGFILSLALCAITIVLSFIEATLLRPFPYSEPDSLVRIYPYNTKAKTLARGCSLLDVEDLSRQTSALDSIGAYVTFDANLAAAGTREPVQMAIVNPSALSMLGVNPVLGRLLRPEEDIHGGDVSKAIISYKLWLARYGGNTDVLGREIWTSVQPYTIVGVMPRGFGFPERSDIWVSMESWYAQVGGEAGVRRRKDRVYPAIARLNPGVSISQAESELDSIAANLEQTYPNDNQDIKFHLISLREAEAGKLKPYVYVVTGAVIFVLLISCSNIGSLLLAHAIHREKLVAIQMALGADRLTVTRMVLLQTTILSVLGAVIGVALGSGAVKILLGLIPIQLPFWLRIEVDWRVILYLLLIGAFAGVILGWPPVMHYLRLHLNDVLKSSERSSTPTASQLRTLLVVAQVAFSVVLLIGTGLMLRSLVNLQNVGHGFKKENLLAVRATNFMTGAPVQLSAAHDRVLARLRELPGVAEASAANRIPYASSQFERTVAEIHVRGEDQSDNKLMMPAVNVNVSPGYFQTMAIPLMRGRFFDSRDTSESQAVIIINEHGANTLWPGMDPIGREVLVGPPRQGNSYRSVIGVVGDIRHQATEGNGIEFYHVYTQYPIGNAYYVVRTLNNPAQAAFSVRDTIQSVSSDTAITFAKPMEQLIDESLWQHRLWSILLSIFSILSLILTTVGVYGLISYSIIQRTREFGIRIALGAPPGSLVRLVLKQGLVMVLSGVMIGVFIALALTKSIESMLYGVQPRDPITFSLVAIILFSTALLACYVPITRVLRVDPVIVLRFE